MAYLKPSFCDKCGSHYQACISAGFEPPKMCYDCQAVEDAAARKEYFANLDKLSIEERIRKIEEWIYNYRPPVDYRNARF